jgi:hypothetical protein
MFRVATPVAAQVLTDDVTYRIHVRFLRFVVGLLKIFSYFFSDFHKRKEELCQCLLN